MAISLLIGAGFSRNWGGWLASEAFEYLLGRPEIIENSRLNSLLWKYQLAGGFEYALAELQAEHQRTSSPSIKADLDSFKSAILAMFNDMNKSFIELIDWDLQRGYKNQSKTIQSFLAKFDAIFTLNQDLLLEQHYLTGVDLSLMTPKRWDCATLPGLDFKPSDIPIDSSSKAKGHWTQKGDLNIDIPSSVQPIYKIHGSSNWVDTDGSPLLIMGGNKSGTIASSPLLKKYLEVFESTLTHSESRLMVIGYGFGDDHINQHIANGVEKGLKLFNLNPAGADLATNLNKTRQSGHIICDSHLEDLFRKALIGASRRSLNEIFGENEIEYQKIMRFFD